MKLDSDVRSSVGADKRAGATIVRGAGVGKLPLVFLLAFMAFIALDRAVVPQVPFNVDPGSYAVVAHELLNGESLYTDIWDHKPPAVFVAYGAAEVVFGYTPETLVILNLVLSLVSLVGIFYAGKAGFGDVFTGLWAAGLWVLLSGVFQLEGRDPNTEPFLNACIIWAFALIAANRPDGLKARTTIAIALLFLLASFFKPIIVPVAACLTIAHVLFSADRRKAFRDAVIISSVGAAGWGGMFGYFAATGRFELFYTTIISYNRFYSGSMVDNIMAPFHGEAEFFPDVLNIVAVLACIGLVLTLTRSLRQAAMLLAFLGSSWVAIALPGRFSVHYYQLWLPSLIVGTSWAIGYLGVAKDLRVRFVSYAMGAIVIASVAFGEMPTYRSVYANDWTPAISLLRSGDDTASRINNLLKPDETFFLWGNTPSLYLLTGRRPPAAVLFDTHFEESPVSAVLTSRVKADLEKSRPELLVAESGRPPVADWLAKDYFETPIYQDKHSYAFYVRRGGRLAERLNLSQH